MKIRLTPLTWFVILSLIAICLALGLSPDPHAIHQLHTSNAAYRFAITALLIPYVLIWYASFYAYAKLQEYSKPLRHTEDGGGFRKVTVGMGALAFSLVVPVIVTLIINNIAVHNPSFKTTATIINNYLALFPGLLAFLLLYNGARQLVGNVRTQRQRLDLRWHAPWFLLLSITFAHLALENHYQRFAYHLGVWWLIVTFIIPYIYGWMVGLLCAYDLRVYASTVNGSLYQQAVKQFANGIAIAILGSIGIQFVTITIAQRYSNSIGSILLIDYGLLIVIGTGLCLMALATKKLIRIEEI